MCDRRTSLEKVIEPHTIIAASMMRTAVLRFAAAFALVSLEGALLASCRKADQPATPMPTSRFAADLAFLREHTTLILLGEPGGAQVALAPQYQGRVLTSTTGGDAAPSFGWIGRAAISSNARQPHMNVFGGEDRFWLGPEGGQFSLYFKKGDTFDLDHWQVPEGIDWGAWDVVEQSGASARFRKRLSLRNYSDTPFEIDVERTVRLLNAADLGALLGEAPAAGVRTVAFESLNTVTNAGRERWEAASGLVSVWILGMFNPSAATTIAIPFIEGSETTLGPVVNDAYFGKVPGDRLVIKPPVIFFKGDGQYRSKIGLSAARALPVAGSYDRDARVLTLVQYTRPTGAARYVNSMWEIQRDPYSGDVINSYNDGPPAPGKPPLGPFYELESSSPALSLTPGERYTHVHRTVHLTGPEAGLDLIARAALKVGLKELGDAFSIR
jgi:hypothetical protein